MAAVPAHPWDPWPGCETVEYRNPLSGDVVRFLMLVGGTGRFMPPIVVTTIPVPAGQGSRLVGTFHAERVVAIPVAFPGPVTDRDELRRWARVLDPNAGEGTLTVVDGAHAGRQLRCVYDAGFDAMEEQRGDVNTGTLLFRSAVPYWRDAQESSVVVQQGNQVQTWFPFLPLILGSSSAFATFLVDNSGDVAAWPVVTIIGPGTQPVVRNLTTGESWTVSGDIAAGSTLVVDTRPGVKTVQVDGANAFGRLQQGSSLWSLQPGSNRVEVAMSGTDPTASVTFAWRRYWLAA